MRVGKAQRVGERPTEKERQRFVAKEIERERESETDTEK